MPLESCVCHSYNVGVDILQLGNDVYWVIVCKDCHTRGPVAVTLDEAIERWNMASRQREVERIRAEGRVRCEYQQCNAVGLCNQLETKWGTVYVCDQHAVEMNADPRNEVSNWEAVLIQRPELRR